MVADFLQADILPDAERQRLGSSKLGDTRWYGEDKHHGWSNDVLIEQEEEGRRLKRLPMLDEFTQEGHVILVARRMRVEDYVGPLVALFRVHGEPACLRFDNGSEFIATIWDRYSHNTCYRK